MSDTKLRRLAVELNTRLDALDSMWPSLRDNLGVNAVFLAAGELITEVSKPASPFMVEQRAPGRWTVTDGRSGDWWKVHRDNGRWRVYGARSRCRLAQDDAYGRLAVAAVLKFEEATE